MSPRRARLTFSAVAIAALGVVACSSSSTGGGEAPAVDAGGTVISCANDPRVMQYAANMAVASPSGNVKVSLTLANPAPPELGLNTWTIVVTDANGDALPSPAATMKVWMPDHGHGPSVVPTLTPTGDGKTYTVTDIDLFMDGVFSLTIGGTANAAIPDQVVYYFCIDG